MERLMDATVAAELMAHLDAIQQHVPLRPLRTVRDHRNAVAALNGLLDAGAADEQHPLAPLAATLGELIGGYEDIRHPAPAVSALDVLRDLMQSHGLRQDQLPEVGSQGVVSEVLRGKRELNLRQVRALGRRFGVPPSVFVDQVA